LITNCIIFYNTTILSRVLAHKEATVTPLALR
jgi:hypothetical protein